MIAVENDILKMDGRHIGKIEGNALMMKRNMAKHFYRVLDAWCLNIEVINSGVERFIIDTEQRQRYIIKLSTIKALRSKINMFVTFNQERQLAIPVQCWDKYLYENLSFPAFIGMPASEFVDTCSGRWRSRKIPAGQLEIAL